MRPVTCRSVTLISGIRVDVERRDVDGDSTFQVTPMVAGRPGHSRSLGPMSAVDLRASAVACGVSDERYIAGVAVEEMLSQVERDGADHATVCVAAAAVWKRTLGPKILALKAASLLCAALLAGWVVVDLKQPEHLPAKTPTPVDQISEEDHRAWFQGPRLDTIERQAARFLLAQVEARDDAICKAAVWTADAVIASSGADPDRINVSVQAAINLLRDREWSSISEIVHRDAHLFGRSPEAVLSRIKGVIER